MSWLLIRARLATAIVVGSLFAGTALRVGTKG